jgi:hypothetical protein
MNLDDDVFSKFLAEHFDAAYYLRSYEDVAKAEVDPLEHWLNCGIKEGRQISKSIDLRFGTAAKRSSSRVWKHFDWRNQHIAARLIRPIPHTIASQIFKQARHDRAVLAAGQDRIARLREIARENIYIDVTGLRRALPNSVEFLLIVSSLGVFGGENLMRQFVAALNDASSSTVQTIVIGEDSGDTDRRPHVPEPFRSTNVLFWDEFWTHTPQWRGKAWGRDGAAKLAQLIRLLHPRGTIVADSHRGHEMLFRFGRAISERTKLCCLYTGDQCTAKPSTPQAFPFATTLTDDVIFAGWLREQNTNARRHDVVILPRGSQAGLAEVVTRLFGST